MKLFLFLDDWMIDAMRDVVRRWPMANAVDVPAWVEANGYQSVHYDKFQKKYRCWYHRYIGKEVRKNSSTAWLEPEIYKGMFYAESDDGYRFQPCRHGGPTDERFSGISNSVQFPMRKGTNLKIEAFSSIFIDEYTQDDSELYKAPADAGFLYTSADGLRWIPHYDRKWNARMDSDTSNNLVYNPVTGRYQVFCRPANIDRRIAVTESKDLKEFSPRKVVLQPDVLDPPLHQFYGLKVFWYEDLFIGLLWDHFVPNVELSHDGNAQGLVKMCGIMDASLAYSYDGLYWLRGSRKPVLPRSPMPEFGWAGHYANSLVVGPDGIIRIYSSAERLEHGEFKQQLEFFARGEGDGAMKVYTLRKDGFAYLESIGGYGWIRTRGLIPNDGELSINFNAPLGRLRVQASDKANKPYEGFTFDDCVPLTGDQTAAKPKWKGRKIEELTGKFVRLEFELYQAHLYAYRWNCKLHYALNPQERI